MINTVDSKGRTVFMDEDRRELEKCTVDFKETGEHYRIRERTVTADGATCKIWVMTIYVPGTHKLPSRR